MAIDLKRISKGREERPPRVLIYAAEAVGKTQFAAGAPSPFFIDADRGSHKLEIERVVPTSWTDTKEWLAAIEIGRVKCDTVVLDSVTQLEMMSHKELFGEGSSIDKYEGGYGRGDTYAINSWREVLAQLERIWLGGKTIVLVAHAVVKTFNAPDMQSYDRYELSLRPKLAGLLKQWVDYILFGTIEIIRADSKSKPTAGARYVHTQRTPAYDAKARGSSMFPTKLPLAWSSFSEAVKGDAARVGEMQAEIESMLGEIADAKLTAQVREYLKSYPLGIVEARARVAARLDETRTAREKEVK